MTCSTTVVWFRQDLRIADQAALMAAAALGAVVPIYIWAPEEEGRWAPGGASRWWLHRSLASLARQLQSLGSRLIIRRGPSLDAIKSLIAETGANSVFWSRRYEPAAIERDRNVKASLATASVRAESFNGSLLHEPWTIATKHGRPFQIFTPFWKACLAMGVEYEITAAPTNLVAPQRWPQSLEINDLELLPQVAWDRGFYDAWDVGAPAAAAQLRQFVDERLAGYKEGRDRIDGNRCSRLSPHLHFGELGPRQVMAAVRAAVRDTSRAAAGASCFMSEIGWREFAYHLMYHFPETVEQPMRPAFRHFPWNCGAAALKRWQRGLTGYPIIDAAMRDLWATGSMPNRARMIVASFLTKDLRIKWQEGAKWFWDTLVDADLANNTLGWQWSAGCGADAAPYFRVFNPVRQAEQFDPNGAYVRRWVPELAGLDAPWIFNPWAAPNNVLADARVGLGKSYPRPIVDHAEAREAALAAFARIRGS